MSNNVDKRVVEMQFDNKQFESNVQTSMSTLEKLKKSLDLEKSAKGLAELESAGKRFSLDGIGRGVETISQRFSTLGIIGVTALQNITNSAINAGKSMLSAFTIEPVQSGMAEYETQIGAIQTILSNTRDSMTKAGYSDAERLDIVNDRLDQLNHYADKTIYNFTEMTRNIGTFTAAGVELDTAVSSIQGIANLAAVSGSTSQQASTAMYQLSQALSSGTVKLMDWNSVVNAGMGGELFQKALIRTASAMGKTVEKTVTTVGKGGKKIKETVQMSVEELIASEGSFRDSLSTGWLTSDVLTATLNQFSYDFEQMAKDMGYTAENMEEGIAAAIAKTKQDLRGQNYSEAEIDEIIQLAQDANDAATKVKTLTQLMDTLKEAAQSGWTQTWEYIIGDFEEAKELWTSFSDFFGDIINTSAESRNKVVEEWKTLGGRDDLFAGVWNIIYSIQNVGSTVRGELQKIFPPKTGQQLADMTKKFRDFTERLKGVTENSEVMGKLGRVIAGVGSALGGVKSGLGWVADHFLPSADGIKGIGSQMLEFAAGLGDSVVNLKESAKNSEAFQGFLVKLGDAGEAVKGGLVDAFHSAKDALSGLWEKAKPFAKDYLAKAGTAITDFVGKIPDGIAKIRSWGSALIEYAKNSEKVQAAWGKIKNFFSTSGKSITDFAKSVKEAVKAFFEADTSGKEDIGEKLKAKFDAVTASFSGWFESAKAKATETLSKIKEFFSGFFNKTVPEAVEPEQGSTDGIADKLASFDWGKTITSVLGMFTGFKVASAVRDFSQFGKGFASIGKSIQNFSKNFQEIHIGLDGVRVEAKDNKFAEIGDILLKVAASIGIVVAAIWLLTKMDPERMKDGLVVLGGIAAGITALAVLFNKLDVDGDAFLKMAGAVALLTIPIAILGHMKTETAVKGIIAIGAVMAELAIFSRLAKDIKGAAFLGVAAAVTLLIIPIAILGTLKLGTIAQGIIAIGIVLAELAAFSIFAEQISGGAFLALAAAVTLLVIPITILGSLKLETLAKGIGAIGVVLLELAGFSILAKDLKLSSFLGMLAVAGIIAVFALSLKSVQDMSWESILAFSLGLSAAVLAITGAMAIMSAIPLPAMLAGSAGLVVAVGAIGLAANLLAKLMGEAFSSFSGEVYQVGANLSGYSNLVAGLNTEAINTSIDVMRDLATLAGELLLVDFSGMENFKRGITSIGGALSLYSTSVSELDPSCSTAAKQMVDDVCEIGVKMNDLIASGVDFTALSYALTNIGSALTLYKESLGSEEDFAGSSNTTYIKQAFEDLANNLPASDLIQTVASYAEGGGNDMTGFALGLAAVGNAVSSFADSAKNVDEGSVTLATNIVDTLAKLQSGLPFEGGFFEWFTGKQQTLDDFSVEIVNIGNALQNFSDSVENADLTKTDDAVKIVDNLVSIQEKLGTDGGILTFFTGKQQDLADFGVQLNTLGAALKDFATNTSEVDADKLTGITAPVDALIELQGKLEETGGVGQWFSGEKSLGDFGASLNKLGSDLKTFFTDTEGIKPDENTTKLTTFIQDMAGVAESLTTFTFGTLESSVIKQLGGDLKQFFTDTNSITPGENSDKIVEFIEKIAAVAGDLGTTNLTYGTTVIGQLGDDLKNIFGVKSGWFTELLSSNEGLDFSFATELTTFVTDISGQSRRSTAYQPRTTRLQESLTIFLPSSDRRRMRLR